MYSYVTKAIYIRKNTQNSEYTINFPLSILEFTNMWLLLLLTVQIGMVAAHTKGLDGYVVDDQPNIRLIILYSY